MIDIYRLCVDLNNSQSDLKQKSDHIIANIYSVLNNPTKKTQGIINGWKEDFRYIYGDVEANLSSNNKLNHMELLARYGIKADEGTPARQVQLLFYAIQTYFSILIKCMMGEILAEDDLEKRDYESILLGDFAVLERL